MSNSEKTITAKRYVWLIAMLGMAFVGITPANALIAAGATINVTSTADNTTAGDGQCTLREAINNANALLDQTGGDCTTGLGADTIRVRAGTYTIAITGAGEDLNATGDFDFTDGLGITITGAGAASTTIDGNGLDRVFHAVAGPITITGVTIQGGSVTGAAGGNAFGGGVYGVAALTITDSTISGNLATGGAGVGGGGGLGGGVYGAGIGVAVTITNSTISGNSATGGAATGLGGGNGANGGGVHGSSVVTITNSTISGNSATGGTNSSIASGGAATGGGVYGLVGVTITNSTISGNSATGGINTGGGSNGLSTGGGVHGAFAGGTITHSTISGNSASYGGGIGGSTTTLDHTIIANNIATVAGANCDTRGSYTSNGYNIENANSCGFANTGDQPNTNPLIGPLADNGGPTFTHALLAGSPAIDAGDPASTLITDQRGFVRPVDGDGNGTAVVDIGAYEFNPLAAALAAAAAGGGCIVATPAVGGWFVLLSMTLLLGGIFQLRRKA